MSVNLLNLKMLLIALLTVTACSHEREKTPELIEANRLHLEAMKISGGLENKLKKIGSQTADAWVKVQLDSLQSLIELWEKNVVEVPGFPHAHDHTHGAHEHKTTPPMTDESMLDYQQKSLEAIRELQKDIEALKIPD